MSTRLSFDELLLDPAKNPPLTAEGDHLSGFFETDPSERAVLVVEHHFGTVVDERDEDRCNRDCIAIRLIKLLTCISGIESCMFRVMAGTDFTRTRAVISRDRGQTWSTYRGYFLSYSRGGAECRQDV